MRDIALGNGGVNSPCTEDNLSPPMIKVLPNRPSQPLAKKGAGTTYMHEVDRVIHDHSDAFYTSREWAQEVARIGTTDKRHILKFCR